MNRQVLRDRNGSRIGEIEETSDGKLILRDKNGSRKGEYNPRNNVTYDRRGRRVGEGNLLTMLLDVDID